jgi:hypothetical protein
MTTMLRASRQGRHVLEDGPRPARRIRLRVRVTPARIAASAAAILLGVFGAVGAAAGSFAYLNSSASTTAGSSITAGNSVITLTSGAAGPASSITMPATVWNRMLPGDFVGQSLTITNTGDATLAISTRLTATSAWEVRVAAGACPATLLPGAAQTTTSTALSSLAAGAATTVCVQASLPASAANSVQGTTAVVSLVVDGVQTP